MIYKLENKKRIAVHKNSIAKVDFGNFYYFSENGEDARIVLLLDPLMAYDFEQDKEILFFGKYRKRVRNYVHFDNTKVSIKLGYKAARDFLPTFQEDLNNSRGGVDGNGKKTSTNPKQPSSAFDFDERFNDFISSL